MFFLYQKIINRKMNSTLVNPAFDISENLIKQSKIKRYHSPETGNMYCDRLENLENLIKARNIDKGISTKTFEGHTHYVICLAVLDNNTFISELLMNIF
ncbi:hypothetical protein BpHYR1_035816 [Brachionus plicatilis]|uniref:Uncharacterized protein n=1 Tax=Brachionus plicatilis TaxID=10195 RepID=A0A3M7SFF9_BRAPC|nr:hypothetical protein BpHYR1_035816 [Brachionus plicatilis]